ncbi:MAG: DUF1269 domain-containing protein [Solirubrobacterales bacterium]
MPDDVYTFENVIAVSFGEGANAYEALARLKELDSKGEISVRDAAVVVREEDGKIVEKDDYGHDSSVGTTTGGLAGLLVGVLGGPLGVLIGGATGLLVGSLFDDDEDEDTESVLSQISKSIKVGFPALLADVSEDSTVAIDAVMDHLGGTVVRRSAADVGLELAAAQDAQRQAKQKARNALREARERKHKEAVDAKIAELKAKLPGHKKAAATTP